MAISTIKQGAHFGATQEVSLPYTAQCSGYIQVYSNPATASFAYDQILINNSALRGICSVSNNGAGVTNGTMVSQGDVVSLGINNNINNRQVFFRALLGG